MRFFLGDYAAEKTRNRIFESFVTIRNRCLRILRIEKVRWHMLAQLRKFWSSILFPRLNILPVADPRAATSPQAQVHAIDLDIGPNDPLMAYLLEGHGVVEVDKVSLDSPALDKLKEAGVKVTVPLISQGELIGLLNLGPRRSEQEYSADDRRLLATLATQAAPALRVAQLARQQQAEARQRERMEQELRIARVVQQTLLPKHIPEITGWRMAAHWQPAREVSGDFYDFIHLQDGRLGFFLGDVTDKGMPAAMVMATTRSVLRGLAERSDSPGKVLQEANNLLVPDIPPNMFVTCLYAVLDPYTGELRYANAGHPSPIHVTRRGALELRARGMPLGLMPDMLYEELVTTIAPGDSLLLFSDGLVEAHNPQGEMFGFPRMRTLAQSASAQGDLIGRMLSALADFSGPGWEQEDDVTFLSIARVPIPPAPPVEDAGWKVLSEFDLPSQPGNERAAMQKVAEAVAPLGIDPLRLERLKTAVTEAAMNGMEHGNRFQADVPLEIQVLESDAVLSVRVTDHGGGRELPEPELPDLESKLAGLQSPRGWGLFLIRNMVDDLQVRSDGMHHTVDLIFKKGDRP